MASTVSLFLLALSASLVLLTVGQKQKFLEHGKEDVCRNYMEECNPWSAGCCTGLFCLNLRKGWCAGPPLERCFCQKKSYFSMDETH